MLDEDCLATILFELESLSDAEAERLVSNNDSPITKQSYRLQRCNATNKGALRGSDFHFAAIFAECRHPFLHQTQRCTAAYDHVLKYLKCACP
jgi:hypothetical protein